MYNCGKMIDKRTTGKGCIPMEKTFYRDTWAEIDLDAIEENIRTIKETLHQKREVVAVVKANGYGHGAIPVAKAALRAGATILAVATFDEAIELRNAHITAPIFVLGWVAPTYAPLAAEKEITLTCFQQEWIDEVALLDLKQPLTVQLKWDTGMGRIGLRTEEELTTIVQALNKTCSIQLIGVFTHFATADEEDLQFYQQQRARFEQLRDAFNALWKHDPIAFHIGNSAAALRFPDEMFDYVRIGIATYGMYPSHAVYDEVATDLTPALSLHSRLVHVKQVTAGDFIGYGCSYQATKDEYIGTVPIGYGDGWRRQLQGMEVLVDGKRMPIVGRISMDQMTIALDKAYPIGTKVTLLGKQRADEITAADVASHIDTIPYEVTCMLTQRVPRVYIQSEC